MKKLNTNNSGRMPLWQKDLDWMQKGYTEPLEALVRELGLSKDYFIITGCSPYKPSQSKMAMNAGWFWYGGKILPVRPLPATSVNQYTNPIVKLSLVHYSDPNGARAFIHADQTTENVGNVWQDDYLTPTVVERSGVVSDGVRIGVGAWTLRDILMHHTAENESDWMPGRSGELEFKRIGRMVVLRGIAPVNTNSQPVDEGFPIPLAGRATLHIPNAPGDFNIYINGNGEIVCISTVGQGEPTLTGMMYMAETPYQATDPNTIVDPSIVDNDSNPEDHNL